jgi:hypothetical protein
MSTSLNSALPTLMVQIHPKLRQKFEPMMVETASLAEVQVMAGLTLRLARLTASTQLLVEAGFKEESQMMLRGALESIVNLFYITHAGPLL